MKRVSVVGNAGSGKSRHARRIAAVLDVPDVELDVVWLDLPRRVIMRQVIGRSLQRVVRREQLWNGNRESLRNLLSWDPHKSIIRWAWTQHEKYQNRFGGAMTSPALAHIDFVRIRSHNEAETWLAAWRAAPR